jgi:hypothetical protein
VASGDVLRAFGMRIHNTMIEVGAKDDFLVHLGPAEFVLAIPSGHLPALQERLCLKPWRRFEDHRCYPYLQ